MAKSFLNRDLKEVRGQAQIFERKPFQAERKKKKKKKAKISRQGHAWCVSESTKLSCPLSRVGKRKNSKR